MQPLQQVKKLYVQLKPDLQILLGVQMSARLQHAP